MPGRILAIGDIHGTDVALEVVLSRIGLSRTDTVVVLGDVVDRGPGTRRAIEILLKVQQYCRLVFIKGNHEEMMLDALAGGEWSAGWLRYGGDATLASYEGDPKNIPEEHLALLRSSVDYWETDTDIFIHANLKPGIPLDQQNAEWLRWMHLSGFEEPHPSGKRVICGHTPQRSGAPLFVRGWACIDTLAFGTGWLTLLDVGTNDILQGSQQSKFRVGRLE